MGLTEFRQKNTLSVGRQECEWRLAWPATILVAAKSSVCLQVEPLEKGAKFLGLATCGPLKSSGRNDKDDPHQHQDDDDKNDSQV